MTTHPTRPGRPAAATPTRGYVDRDHCITGTATQLANIIANHRTTGTLVALTTPRPLSGGRFQVVIRLREQGSTRSHIRVTSVGDYTRTRVRRPRRPRTAFFAATVTGVAVSVVYLIGQLVELITAHSAVAVCVLVLAAGLAVVARRRRSPGRRHCPGC